MEHKKFRIYLVTDEVNGPLFLVKARSKAESIRHVSRKYFSCRNIGATEVIYFLERGARIEDANVDCDIPLVADSD